MQTYTALLTGYNEGTDRLAIGVGLHGHGVRAGGGEERTSHLWLQDCKTETHLLKRLQNGDDVVVRNGLEQTRRPGQALCAFVESVGVGEGHTEE